MTIDVAPVKPTISFDALAKIDVRVGTIELVEADGITPVLATPEKRVPNGARAG